MPKPIVIKRPKQLSAKKFLKIKAKEERCLALCLIVYAMYPEDAVYATANWEPRVSRSEHKNSRECQIRKIAKAVTDDPRRLAS